MRFGSVCSGIEAASVAWEPLGWRAEWLAEIEKFPVAVLAHHWPDVPNHGDMLALPNMVANDNIPAPDVLVGGTPCQAFSVAGKRGSLADERGALTLAFVELADEIDRRRAANGFRPAVVVWENVPGVLSTNDNAFGCFIAGLAGETVPLVPPGGRWANAGAVFGPARAVAWRILDAQYFGVAQRRRRVFVVASARDGFDPCAVLFEQDGVRRDIAPSREALQSPASDAGSGTAGGSFWNGEQVTQTLDAVLHKGQAMPEKNRFPAVLIPHNDNAPHSIRRLTPRECERLQGFPDDHTLIPLPMVGRQTRQRYSSDSARYKAIGNSMAVPVMRWIGARIARQITALNDNQPTNGENP